jgi:DNA replication and repair protein RecF
LAALLAQAEDFAARRGQWPLVLLDDLASELDLPHQRRLLQRLRASDAQIFITGTEVPPALSGTEFNLFHVEHGVVARAKNIHPSS